MRITGQYYGQPFAGVVERQDANWENGSFAKSPGRHLYVRLDSPVAGRDLLFLNGWTDGACFPWGFASVQA